jgi:hypothetical protein
VIAGVGEAGLARDDGVVAVVSRTRETAVSGIKTKLAIVRASASASLALGFLQGNAVAVAVHASPSAAVVAAKNQRPQRTRGVKANQVRGGIGGRGVARDDRGRSRAGKGTRNGFRNEIPVPGRPGVREGAQNVLVACVTRQ